MIEIDCDGFSTLLGGYVDGTLLAEEVAVVEKHASSCATCAARLSQHRRVDSLLRAAPAPLPTRQEWDALLAHATRPLVIHWRRIAAAALVAIALPLSIGALSRRSDVSAGYDVLTPSLDTDL